MTRMKALSESHRVLELERKLFAAESALKQGRTDIVNLQVKIEELQMKYEPNGKLTLFHFYIVLKINLKIVIDLSC